MQANATMQNIQLGAAVDVQDEWWQGRLTPYDRAILGEVMCLFFASQAHLRFHSALTIFNATVLPIVLGQFELVREGNLLKGYYCWANVDQSVSRRIESGQGAHLTPDEWQSGNIVWIMDAVSRRGCQQQLENHLKKRFSGTAVRAFSIG